MARNRPITSVLSAAAMHASGIPLPDIAAQHGVTVRAINRWSHTSEWEAAKTEIVADTATAVRHRAVATKARRVLIADRLIEGLLDVVEARRASANDRKDWDPAMPGEDTGLVVVKHVMVGRASAKEAAVDSGLVKAVESLLIYCAKELGQWSEKTELHIDMDSQKIAEDVAAETGLPLDEVFAEVKAVLAESRR